MGETEDWHLDKRVPISLIGVLIVQTVLLVWFLAELRFDLNSQMVRVDRLEVDTRADRLAITQNQLTGAVISTTLSNIEESLRRIENRIENDRRNNGEENN